MTADILVILDAMAKERAIQDGTTYERAYKAVLLENPNLYQQYDDAAKAEQAGMPRDAPRVPRHVWYDELSKRGFWIDPQVFFLRCVLNVSDPQVELNLREIARLEDTERREALRSWAQRLNLTASWCAEKAFELVKPPAHTDPPPFRFESEGWSPYFGRGVMAKAGFRHLSSPGRVDTEQRIRDEFEKALSNHFREMEAEARAHGWLDPRAKRMMEHFSWLAEFQVARIEYADIAKTVNIRKQSVRNAVIDTATLIALPLRTARRGRPPKKTV